VFLGLGTPQGVPKPFRFCPFFYSPHYPSIYSLSSSPLPKIIIIPPFAIVGHPLPSFVMSSPPHSSTPPSDSNDDDVDEDDLSVDLLAPSQDAEPASSPVQNSHALSGFVHPLSSRVRGDPFVRCGPVVNPFLRNLRAGNDEGLLTEGHRGESVDDDSDESVCHRRSSRRTRLLDDDDEAGDDDVGNDDAVNDDAGNDDARNDDTGDDDAADHCDGHAVDDQFSDDDESDSISGSDGTVVPGTAYDVITALGRRQAIERRVPVSSLADMDPVHERWIRIAMLDDWGIQTPHDWQIRAISDIAFSRDTSTYLIAKTGSGKSAVPLTVGSLLTGITVTMVPLVGLGSDQVNKCSNPDNFIEGYHLDEHRGRDGGILRKRLLSVSEYEADNVSIFLYASPQSLQVGSDWYHTLMTVSAKNLIRLIVIDEAHSVARDGRDFRPAFKTAVSALRNISDNLPTPCNFLAMSATFRQDDQDEISRLWKRPPDKVIWRELSRRGIGFGVVISGNPTSSVVRSMSLDYRDPTSMKTIVYTNSKTSAMGPLTKAFENMLEKSEASWRANGIDDFLPGRVIPFTGDDGLQSKVHIMRAWAHNYDDGDDIDDDLPNLLIMPATKAADCGVSSNSCRRSYRVGLASNLYCVVQEMGRVDRVPLGDDGDAELNRYEVHLSFKCAVKLFTRIMQHPEKSERNLQLEDMMSVLCFLVVPNECHHVSLEKYFEDRNTTRAFLPCTHCCCKCRRSRLSTTGRINRGKLTRLLMGYCSTHKSPTTDELVKFVKDRQQLIFHQNDQPTTGMGPIHALCLQLIATGILEFGIDETRARRVGKSDIHMGNIVIQLGSESGEPKAMFDRYWTNIHVSTDELQV